MPKNLVIRCSEEVFEKYYEQFVKNEDCDESTEGDDPEIRGSFLFVEEDSDFDFEVDMSPRNRERTNRPR